MAVKQVIVIRKDLKMRRGKEIAQGAHASIAWLAEKTISGRPLTPAEQEWLAGQFTKITLQVNSEEELFEISIKAHECGLMVTLIQDAGKTEFKEPTYTCLAIGPANSEDIDIVTGHLKLY